MELWDLYTADRKPTGKTMVRGAKHPEGCYNIGIYVWIRNKEGKYLISQRAANKASYPLFWETVGGCVLAGETSLQGAVREVKEEIGIDLDPSQLHFVFSQAGIQWNGRFYREILDVYLYELDGEYDEQKAVSDEVPQSKWMTVEEIRQFLADGRMIPILSVFFDKVYAMKL